MPRKHQSLYSVMEIDWAAPAAWRHRTTSFGALHRIGTSFVAMELEPRTIDRSWAKLRDAWIALPRHTNLLGAIDRHGQRGVLARYAAIDWWKPVLHLEHELAMRDATAFGAQLADLFEMILERVHGDDRALFLQPCAFIDLDDELRVGFECGSSMRPPEMKLDERAFVYVIGRLWMSMLDHVPANGLGKIIQRCVDVNPRARFGSFEKLKQACFAVPSPRGLRSGPRLAAWEWIEEGLGWRERGDRDLAYACFRKALGVRLRNPPYDDIAAWGAGDTAVPWMIGPSWKRAAPPVVEPPALPPPVAREPPITPARASYREGRELLLQRKLHEAHVCFSAAALLDPMMLEAQLLRREVERMLARVRATTGIAAAATIDMPASLREVRDIVVGGNIQRAIALLSTGAYAGNADAALFRARLLAMDAQYEPAAAQFAAIVDGPHRDEARLGLARVRIDRGELDAASAILDEILATRPRDLGALEARARCLELLGDARAASEAMRAFVAAVELASDVRIDRVR
jgi:tetratricopeptide (TPR) repeat protein